MKLNGCCCRKLAIFPFNFHKDFVSIFFSSFYFYFTTLLFVETPPTIWFDNKLQSLCEIRRNKRRSKWIIVVCFDFYREHSAEMRIAINCTKSYVGWILFAFRCKQIRKYTWMRSARSVSLWMARFFLSCCRFNLPNFHKLYSWWIYMRETMAGPHKSYYISFVSILQPRMHLSE